MSQTVLSEFDIALLDFVRDHPHLSSKEIYDAMKSPVSYPTLKRALARSIEQNLLVKTGTRKSTKYQVSPAYDLFYPISAESYFDRETEDRIIKVNFQVDLINTILKNAEILSPEEANHLENLHAIFVKKISGLSPSSYAKEMERLAIDLSWKSSQIEGNTYSLLETEFLLKEKISSSVKEKSDAIMLLNHKTAIDFILEHTSYLHPLSISKIEDIHSILIKDLGVDRNLRKRRVGISGTNYIPPDNEHQTRSAMEDLCVLVNSRESAYEKALLILVLISYIQPFVDGNKRTARIISNAILVHHGYCPLSFRTVSPLEYKKAMLIFYEQNNILPAKKMFIEQVEFAVRTYF